MQSPYSVEKDEVSHSLAHPVRKRTLDTWSQPHRNTVSNLPHADTFPKGLVTF